MKTQYMPLYMDFHHTENATVEDIQKAHMADVALQQKYGVRYLQFWVNQKTGAVFCLIEGPDPETCAKVHQIAHDDITCALTEVGTGFYEMTDTGYKVNDYGRFQKKNGSVDTGYRTILVVALYSTTKATAKGDLSTILTPGWARKIVREQMEKFEGRHLAWDADDSLMTVFDEAIDAVDCALAIKKTFEQSENKRPDIIYKMGLSASQPVTLNHDFFRDAVNLGHRLSLTAPGNQILTCALVRRICKNEDAFSEHLIKSLNTKEQEFISNLIYIVESNISDQRFDLNKLSNEICISRSQLYRKITALTGRSPNDFITDLRMQKALSLLKQKKYGIGQIAYSSGFNSPSYFSKCFAEKFGCPPSTFLKEV